MSHNPGRVVTVEILGQRYPVRSSLDPGYVSDLATYVDEKMRAAADKSPGGDSLKVAVLTMLVATPVGVLAAYGLHASRVPYVRAAFVLILTPMMVPLVLVAIGVSAAAAS